MSTRSGDATADLISILLQHCPQTATATAALQSGGPGLSWTPMTLGDIPGVSELVGTLKPPVEVVRALLKFIGGILEILQAFLVSIVDPIRAVIMAAYELLRTIVDDFLATGAYLYVDIPGLMSNRKTLNDMGARIEEPPQWLAGDLPDPERPAPGGFDAWAETFVRSFDDPGDEHRPIFSDGSPVEALFIVATFPSLIDFTRFAKLWRDLVDDEAFVEAVEEFNWASFDVDLSETRRTPVAPNWRSWKLRDIAPPDYPMRELEKVPEYLKRLLSNVDNIVELLKKLIAGVQEKVKILERFVKLIESVIDILRALSATGMHCLPVVTSEGVEGLKRAFLEAENRPNTDPETGEPAEATAIVGACFMAGASGLVPANPQLLWAMLGQGKSFDEAYGGMLEDFEAVKDVAQSAWDDTVEVGSAAAFGTEGMGGGPLGVGVAGLAGELEEQVGRIHDQAEEYFENLSDKRREEVNAMLGILGMDFSEADALFSSDRNAFMNLLEQAMAQQFPPPASPTGPPPPPVGGGINPVTYGHIEATRRARRRGARGLAMAAEAGAIPIGPAPGTAGDT